jgi:hypothetical protein
MASQRQRSWFATPVDFLQLSLETTLSLIVRLDEFRENAMLVVYERVHLRKEAHLAIKIRGHIAIKVRVFVILGAVHGEQPRRSHIGMIIPIQKPGLEHPPTGHLAGWTVR